MRRLVPLVLALVSASCTQVPVPIVFGHVADFSGAGKGAADQEANGIRLALDEIETQAESDKTLRPVAVRRADDHGKPEIAVGQATRLSSVNRVVALLSGSDIRTAQSLADSGVPVFAAVGHDAPKLGDRIVKLGLDPERRGKLLAKYLREKVKPAAIVLLTQEDDEAQRAARGFLAEWPEDARPRLWQSQKLPTDDATWKQFAEKPPMGLAILFGGPVESIRKRPEMEGRSMAYAGPEFAWRGLEKSALPVYLVTAFAPGPQTPEAEAFAKRYEEKFSKPAEPAAALAYEGLKLATQLARKSPMGLVKVRDELGSLGDFAGLSGKYPTAGGTIARPAYVGRLEVGTLHDVAVDVPEAKK